MNGKLLEDELNCKLFNLFFNYFFLLIGDILAKSFKWIYAKVCLCRICPGVAKRRAMRERRKQRALSLGKDNLDDDFDVSGVVDKFSKNIIKLKPKFNSYRKNRT